MGHIIAYKQGTCIRSYLLFLAWRGHQRRRQHASSRGSTREPASIQELSHYATSRADTSRTMSPPRQTLSAVNCSPTAMRPPQLTQLECYVRSSLFEQLRPSNALHMSSKGASFHIDQAPFLVVIGAVHSRMKRAPKKRPSGGASG